MPSLSGIYTLTQHMKARGAILWPPFVPNAPTISTATQTGSTTATVAFTAPVYNGGSPITSYTATSSPSGGTGTLSQAGSGTISVTGLSPVTSYTFTVTATNDVGTGAASAASNSITTAIPDIGAAFGGGFFAGQIGTSSVATHNLIVGPVATAINTSLKWKNARTTTAGSDSTTDGAQNTADMVADGNSTVYPCAHFCNNLSTGGQTDWYMPAARELEICYFNLKPTTTSNNTSVGQNANAIPARNTDYTAGTPARTSAAAFQTGGAEEFTTNAFWSSTETNFQHAPKTIFSTGNIQNNYYKDTYARVRAIRRIAV